MRRLQLAGSGSRICACACVRLRRMCGLMPAALVYAGGANLPLSPPTTYLAREKYGGQIGGGGQMGGAGTRKKGRGGTRDWSVVHGTQRPCVSLLHYFFNTYNNI